MQRAVTLANTRTHTSTCRKPRRRYKGSARSTLSGHREQLRTVRSLFVLEDSRADLKSTPACFRFGLALVSRISRTTVEGRGEQPKEVNTSYFSHMSKHTGSSTISKTVPLQYGLAKYAFGMHIASHFLLKGTSVASRLERRERSGASTLGCEDVTGRSS